MTTVREITIEVERLAHRAAWSAVLGTVIRAFAADSGTLHLLGNDGHLHLAAASDGIPSAVVDAIRIVPVGKGMAGLAVERRQPVDACNLQTDTSGDVRPGARVTGLQGSIVVPLMRGDAALGALGIANRGERVFTSDEQSQLVALGRVIAGAIGRGSEAG